MKNDNIFFTKTTEIGAKNEPIEMFATGNRITPQPSATSVKEGTVAFSDGGDLCYTKKDKNGVGRWFSFGLKINFNELNYFKLSQKWSGIKGNYNGNVGITFEAKGTEIDPLEISIITTNMSPIDLPPKYEINSYAKMTASATNKAIPVINSLILEPLENGIEWLRELSLADSDIDVEWQYSKNDLLANSEQRRQDTFFLLQQDYKNLNLFIKAIILKYPNLANTSTPNPKFKIGDLVVSKGGTQVMTVIKQIYDDNEKIFNYVLKYVKEGTNNSLFENELERYQATPTTTTSQFKVGDNIVSKQNGEIRQILELDNDNNNNQIKTIKTNGVDDMYYVYYFPKDIYLYEEFKVGDIVYLTRKSNPTTSPIKAKLGARAYINGYDLNLDDLNQSILSVQWLDVDSANGQVDGEYPLIDFKKEKFDSNVINVGDIVEYTNATGSRDKLKGTRAKVISINEQYGTADIDILLNVEWINNSAQKDGEYTKADFIKVDPSQTSTTISPTATPDEIKIGDIVELNNYKLSRGYNVKTGTQAEVLGIDTNSETLDIKWLTPTKSQQNGKYLAMDFTKVSTPAQTSTINPATETPNETIERLLSYETSDMWATKPTIDAVRRAFFSKRRTKAQKIVISQAFGLFQVIAYNGQFWQEFVPAWEKEYGYRVADEKYYYKYSILPEFANLIPESFVRRLSTRGFLDFNDEEIFPIYFEDILKNSVLVESLCNAYEDFLLEKAEAIESVVEKPIAPKTPNVVTHNSVVPNKTLEDLKKEYSDLIFLISVTSPLDFKEMTELKQEAEKIKAHINSTNLSIKDKMLKENNIFDELFSSSCIQPKHRYDLKPNPNGFAPDGTPTQLPKSIYDFTLTDDFENWFGNFQLSYQFRNSNFTEVPCSIVKNIHYEPQIVYHGTGQEFSYFDFSKFPIMYFAENYFYAEWFAQQKGQQNGHDGFVYPFFLDIKNPLDLTHFGIDEITSQEFADWLYLQTGLEADELKINPALMKSTKPTYAWVYLRNGAEMLKVLSDTKLFDGIVYYEQNPPINPTANNYKTKGFIIFEPQSAKIVDPERHNLLLGSMRSFYLKRGGKL